jgi:hypothetical protein
MQSESFLSDMGPRSSADGERLSILSANPAIFVPQEIRALSDADLIAATRVLRRGIAGYAWLIVPTVTTLAGFTLGKIAAVVACIVTIVACKVGLYLHERSKAVARGQLAKREFCSRYHIGALTLDETAAVTQMAEDHSINAVMLFRAWALPHGGHRFIRIEFGVETRIAIYTTPFLGDLQSQASAQGRMAKLDLPLSVVQAARLRDTFEELSPAEIAKVPAHAIFEGAPLAGLPCDVVVLRRNAPTLRASMNFRGIASIHKFAPAERLVSEVLDIEGEITGTERFEVDPLLRQEAFDLVARSV